MYTISTTPAFLRLASKLVKKHFEIVEVLQDMETILEIDPFNVSRQHNIKKLSEVRLGQGQRRIRHGAYRIRYDIVGNIVRMSSITNRKDAYR